LKTVLSGAVKAVLESKWPTGSLATGFQLWMKLRNVVTAVAQFRTALGDQRQRHPSLSSSSDDPDYDVQSIDSIQDVCTLESGPAASNHLIIVDNDVSRQNIDSGGNYVVRMTSSGSTEISAKDRLTVHEDTVVGSEQAADVCI